MSGETIHAHPTMQAATALLEAAGLPVVDLTDAHLEHFFYCGPAQSPSGLVGVEFCGPDALLRSLVVAPACRGAGVGAALTRHAETYARSRDAHSVFLLTTTAESFFRRMGYTAVDRAIAPPAIRATREFADICPASSAFLSRKL